MESSVFEWTAPVTVIGLAVAALLIIVAVLVIVLSVIGVFPAHKLWCIGSVSARLFWHWDELIYSLPVNVFPSTTASIRIKGGRWLLVVFRTIAALYLLALVFGGVGISQYNEPAWAEMTSNTAWVYFIYNSYWTLVCTCLYFMVVTCLTIADRFFVRSRIIDVSPSGTYTRVKRTYSRRIPEQARLRIEGWTWAALETVGTAQLFVCIGFWSAYTVIRSALPDDTPSPTFVSGSAHAIGLAFVVIELCVGSRRWVFSHIVFPVSYALIWITSSIFLYIATGMFAYNIQDPSYTSPALACAFYPLFVLGYALSFGIMYTVEKALHFVVNKVASFAQKPRLTPN